MIKLRETIYYDSSKSFDSHEYNCPKCSGAIYWQKINCPFNYIDCKDEYFGLVCNLCKSIFQETIDMM